MVLLVIKNSDSFALNDMQPVVKTNKTETSDKID